jgi:hypothetical protein
MCHALPRPAMPKHGLGRGNERVTARHGEGSVSSDQAAVVYRMATRLGRMAQRIPVRAPERRCLCSSGVLALLTLPSPADPETHGHCSALAGAARQAK